MSNVPPLLRPFFERDLGCVLYKGYPPARADDAPALLDIRARLPTGVRFVPVPPDISYLQDLRKLLPSILTDKKLSLRLPDLRECLVSPDGTREDLRALTDELPDDWRHSSRKDLFEVIAQTLRWMRRDHSRESIADIMRQLRSQEQGLVSTMLRIVALGSTNRPSTLLEPTDQRDYVRSLVHVPTDQPLLVVGRPELFLGYHSWDDGQQEPTDLRWIVESAGYPNRFHFFADRPNAPDTRGGIRDRKTRRVYREALGQWRERDVGFVFVGRCSRDQVVIVATGLSSLGTHAALGLLLEHRRGFEEAMERVAHGDNGAYIDIAFHCELQQLRPDRRFPLSTESDALRITLLNPDDVVGYTWAREARSKVERLLDTFDEQFRSPNRPRREQLGNVKYMAWEWEAPPSKSQRDDSGQLVDVTIHGNKRFGAFGGRSILASEPLGVKLEEISRDVEVDKEDWERKVRKWRTQKGATLQSIASDPSYRTWRPILLLGRTGVGKELVAEFIARKWEGAVVQTLPKCREGKQKCDCLRQLASTLSQEVDKWPSKQVGDNERMWPFAVLAHPPDLLDAALFGAVKGAYTGADFCQPGALVKAGTGVVFLDEFLELDLKLQASLLVALNDGQVQPAGASGESCCYVSRVVAATNRAAHLEELRLLSEEQKVREDLVARFPRRYVVPTLPERPLEIVPILIDILRRERLQSVGNCHIRLSRPAFEALITFSYPENIRDLINLAFELPNELVASFEHSFSDGHFYWSDHTIRESAILLEHLGRLGISPLETESGNGWEGAHRVTRDPEDEFYQFSIAEDAEGLGAAARSCQRQTTKMTPVLEPNKFEEFCSALQKPRLRGRVTAMRDVCVRVWRAGPVIESLKGVFGDARFVEALRELYVLLWEIHDHLYEKGIKDGLRNTQLQRSWFSQPKWAALSQQMPLAMYEQPPKPQRQGFFTWLKKKEEEDLYPHVPREARPVGGPRMPGAQVILSVLYGERVTRP